MASSQGGLGRFDRRRAIVTGGASGIGRATARLLRKEGALVAVLDRDIGSPAAAGDALHAHQVDLVDEAAVSRAFDAAAESLGGPADYLVASAGVYVVAALDTLECRSLGTGSSGK